MTKGLLEEIVMGNRTRQRPPCARVNSPNHPPGTWGPRQPGGAEEAPAQTDPPGLCCLSALSPALSVTCMCPSLPSSVPKPGVLKSPPFAPIDSQLLLSGPLWTTPSYPHLKRLRSSLIASGCGWRRVGALREWRQKPHITSCIYLSGVASE